MSFLFTVLAIWGTMHAYVFARAWAYTGVSWRWAAVAAPVWVALMASPLFGMVLERAGHPVAARVVAVPGMVWAGAFFLLFSVSLVHDLYNGILTLASFAAPAAGRARLLGARPIIAEVALVALITAYSVVEANAVRIRHVELPTSKLDRRIRVTQITDVHLGMSVGRTRLARIVRLVESTKPDVIVSTGDLVDSSLHGSEQLAGLLEQMKAPLGKFAVTGNHEYYAGLPQSLEFTRRAGFEMLRKPRCARQRGSDHRRLRRPGRALERRAAAGRGGRAARAPTRTTSCWCSSTGRRAGRTRCRCATCSSAATRTTARYSRSPSSSGSTTPIRAGWSSPRPATTSTPAGARARGGRPCGS